MTPNQTYTGLDLLMTQSEYAPELRSEWRGRQYTTRAVGTLRIYKPEGIHREQVFTHALNELRKLIDEMYRESYE